MFSLIITLIAIALVAALALATLYYGGPVFNEGSERALAAKLDAQGQQIMGALELYNAEMGHYPATLEDLVSTNYLKAIPTAAAEQAVMAAAYAATGTWSLSSPGQPVIVMKPVSLATCQAFNKSNLGVSGVLQQAHSTKLKQCIGTDVNNLMIIQPKAASDLIYVSTDPSAVVQIGNVLTTPVPPISDISNNGWLNTQSSPLTYTLGYSTSTLNFGAIEIGATSAPQAVTITNTGTGTLTIAGVEASPPFATGSSDCASLAPGATCFVQVTFSPLAAQEYAGASYSLAVASPTGPMATLPLTGSGQLAQAQGPFVAELNLTYTGTSLNSTWTPKSDADFSRFGNAIGGYGGAVIADSWNMDTLMGYYGSWTRVYETASPSTGYDQVLSVGHSQSGAVRMGSPAEWNSKPDISLFYVITPYAGGDALAWNSDLWLPLPEGASNDMTWCVTFDMNVTAAGGSRRVEGGATWGACP